MEDISDTTDNIIADVEDDIVKEDSTKDNPPKDAINEDNVINGNKTKTSDKKNKNVSEKKPTKKKKSAKQYALEFFIKIILTVLVIWILCNYVIGIYAVHSNSGYPMLKDGDLCIAYRLSELYSGDEVAYIHDGVIHFGRIVGMPGDTVDINEDSLTINGYGVYEETVYPTTGEGAKITFPYNIPSDSYFILNDYRSDITDSRSYGAVPKEDIKGKIIFIMRLRGI